MYRKTTPELLKAAQKGDIEALKAGFAAGEPVDGCDRYGATLLYLAAASGRIETVEFLLSAGASVEQTSDAGNSPLMIAAARGHEEVVRRLLAAGASSEHKNKWGFGARDWAQWPSNADVMTGLVPSAVDS